MLETFSMHIAKSDREEQIRRLQLAEPVTTFLCELSVPEELQYLFSPPFYFYAQGSPGQPGYWLGLDQLRLLPLWEHSEQTFVTDLNAFPVRYLSFYGESPTEIREFGVSIYSMIFQMIDRHVWEYGGTATEGAEAFALAERLGFPNLDMLHQLLSDPVAATEEQVAEYRSQLIC